MDDTRAPSHSGGSVGCEMHSASSLPTRDPPTPTVGNNEQNPLLSLWLGVCALCICVGGPALKVRLGPFLEVRRHVGCFCVCTHPHDPVRY